MWFARRGVNLWGAQVLTVRGRKSGEPRTTPVNPLTLEGRTYLVAPRGHVQWTHNMRAAGGGELRIGRKVRRFDAAEVPDDEKPPVLRAYREAWKSEVGRYFEGHGITAESTDEEWRAVARHYPVFAVIDRL
ncbi:nitroreductase family deazaflavin-dependent oxidoreductase [Streptomyces sp. ACA25]|uniref:nitroreductase family deazaflavin-dependent oxidoreductase n=1 Tax=Streptomyces sp. ACA25 TaxID=3022596 RepID=UPI00230711FF|nr:nitroreductase family deazaflavin-dependent oxidoreductase [Streptomyces sp. ACA25]MDB1089321.1 nitroreductase family deazaflavin-dependent oxidoreductase [Streptomyces sp. ACA25]